MEAIFLRNGVNTTLSWLWNTKKHSLKHQSLDLAQRKLKGPSELKGT